MLAASLGQCGAGLTVRNDEGTVRALQGGGVRLGVVHIALDELDAEGGDSLGGIAVGVAREAVDFPLVGLLSQSAGDRGALVACC